MNPPLPHRARLLAGIALALAASALVGCGVSGEASAPDPAARSEKASTTTTAAPSSIDDIPLPNLPDDLPSAEELEDMTDEELEELMDGMSSGSVPTAEEWPELQPAFDEAIADVRAAGKLDDELQSLDLPAAIGGFEVLSAWSQDGAVIITTSAGWNDRGVAYLPDGPFPELENGSFERPEFEPLGGDWYTWSASW